MPTMDIPDNTNEEFDRWGKAYQSPEESEPEAAITETVVQQPKAWGFWATSIFSLAILTVFFVIQMGVGTVYLLRQLVPSGSGGNLGQTIQADGLVLSLATIVSAIPALGMIYLFVQRRQRWTFGEYLGLRCPPWRSLLVWIAIIAVFQAGSETLACQLGRPFFSEFMVHVYRTAVFVPLLWFTVIVVAPVFEEIFFRGFMFRGIAASPLGPVGAIVITALSWAVIHVQYDYYNMATIFLMGILFGIARVQTKSVATTIVLHAATNLAATVQVAWYVTFMQ